MTTFGIGADQTLAAADEMRLLTGLEAAIDFCLARGNVFAIFDWQDEFCQLLLDPDHDMHVESSFGDLAQHAGFTDQVDGYPWLWGSRLPAQWHARAKMAAGAMTRAFIEAGKIDFPTELSVTILPTKSDSAASEPGAYIEGAPSVGFMFGEDRPMGWFIEGLTAHLDLDPAVASIPEIMQVIHSQLENEHGPLNRETRSPIDADYVVELDRDGFTVRAGPG